jgi:hypothetical protein
MRGHFTVPSISDTPSREIFSVQHFQRHDDIRKYVTYERHGTARHKKVLSTFLFALLFSATTFCGATYQNGSISAAPVRGSRILSLLFDTPASQTDQDASISRFNGYWLLNARDVSRPSDEHLTADYVQIQRREPPSGLTPSSHTEFVERWPENEPLVLFIHGNLGTEEVAFRHGDLLHGLFPRDQVPPFQFAVWAWRSDREIRRTLQDAQIKAARTDEEAYRLAVFLRELPPDREIIFIGYSFGTRIACGALQLLEGGTLEGRTLDLGVEESSDTANDEKRWTLYLLAPAMDADWFRPGGLYGETLNDVEKIFVTHNHRDRVLKIFSRVDLPGRKRMMGVQRTPSTLGDGFQPRWIDLTGEVGFRHGFARSSESPTFRRSLVELLTTNTESTPEEDIE